MFDLKKRLLKSTPGETGLQEQSERDRVMLATCVILLEMAKSDDEFSSIEKTTISSILNKEFLISDEATEELMEIAHRKREESIDLWEFTHLINENYSIPEKRKVVELAWKVIYADDKLDKYEDHLVHKLARLLQLEHSDLIEAKMKVKLRRKE